MHAYVCMMVHVTNSFLLFSNHTEYNILLSAQCYCRDILTSVCLRERKCEVAIADFDSIAKEGAS